MVVVNHREVWWGLLGGVIFSVWYPVLDKPPPRFMAQNWENEKVLYLEGTAVVALLF